MPGSTEIKAITFFVSQCCAKKRLHIWDGFWQAHALQKSTILTFGEGWEGEEHTKH
ncbi:hypothetical protein Nmel_005354, partial [Mimus melanotis]